MLFNAFHLPPYLTAELDVTTKENFVMLRLESLVACLSTLRVYMLLRMVVDMILASMPKRQTISSYTGVNLGAIFAFKKLFNGWIGVACVAIMWSLSLVILAYWFRATEATACLFASAKHHMCATESARMWTSDGLNFYEKTNDMYYPNAMWMMYVTSATGMCMYVLVYVCVCVCV